MKKLNKVVRSAALPKIVDDELILKANENNCPVSQVIIEALCGHLNIAMSDEFIPQSRNRNQKKPKKTVKKSKKSIDFIF